MNAEHRSNSLHLMCHATASTSRKDEEPTLMFKTHPKDTFTRRSSLFACVLSALMLLTTACSADESIAMTWSNTELKPPTTGAMSSSWIGVRPNFPIAGDPANGVTQTAIVSNSQTAKSVLSPPEKIQTSIQLISQETAAMSGSEASENPVSQTLSSLELSRPVMSISLSSSLVQTDAEGEELRTPHDEAQALFNDAGVYFDQPCHQADAIGWCPQFAICHNPLYFEDPNMERCGQGFGCLTEVASLARFFGRIPIMPYMYGSNHPKQCVRSPGHCPACHRYGFHAYIPPLNFPGVAAQAAATVGLIFIIP